MKYFFILFISLVLLGCIPEKSIVEIEEKVATKTEKPFPQNWYGKWKGTLMVYNYKGDTQKIPMEIHCGPTDSTHRHRFVLVYGEDKNLRDYELVAIDAENGHYQTDEKNTIFLDGFYFDGIFYSRYEVSNSLMTTQIEKRNDKLYFSLISGSLNPIATTGDEEINNFPPVNSFNITVSQRAELIRYE